MYFVEVTETTMKKSGKKGKKKKSKMFNEKFIKVTAGQLALAAVFVTVSIGYFAVMYNNL